jgi:Copper resistance protein K
MEGIEMYKALATLVIGCGLSLSACAAVGSQDVSQIVPLKDGSMLYVFRDGKMGIEDKLGRPSYMKPGTTLETREGRKIVMVGNEVARVTKLSPREGQ